MLKPLLRLPVMLLALTPAAGAAATDAPTKLPLVDAIDFVTAGVPKTVQERERFLGLFRQSLATQGWDVIVSSDTCDGSEECLSAAARNVAAPYALRISGEGNLLRGYKLQIQLYSVKVGYLHETSALCDLCITDRIAQVAAGSTVQLLAQATKSDKAHAAPVASRGKERLGTPVRPDLTRPPTIPSAPSSRWLPWTMVAVGVAGVAYGGWALLKDEDLAEDKGLAAGRVERRQYSSALLGGSLLAGGAILSCAGLVMLLTEPAPTRVSITPSGVHVAGRF